MDKYTKAVLTVIAVCLVVQTAKDIAFVEPAYASDVRKIALCDTNGRCADVVDRGRIGKYLQVELNN
jgi:hypothetical protein